MTDDPPEQPPDPGKPFTYGDEPPERPEAPDPGKPDQKGMTDEPPDPGKTETRDD